ncbi:MAG: acetyl-CoA carboxylase biotin carboxyl carrier protein [Pirellulales bacterium]|nr:acetyl-CoA carboxylase biotin carboxyl carrier protein [Pirellulales bacterium]
MTGPSSSSNKPDIFDVRKIRRLVELMKEHELSEIDLRQEGTRVQIRRGVAAPTGPVGPPVVSVQPAASPSPAPAAGTPTPSPAADKNIAQITSPIVGTFYSASDPDAQPYVKVGDHVGPDTTVCLIEAMKVFNEIPAQTSGKIIAVLVKNGDPVEYGQPLFKVDTQG